jgi:hypothetical protein
MNIDLPRFALTGQTPRYAGLGWSMGDRDQGSSDCASRQQRWWARTLSSSLPSDCPGPCVRRAQEWDPMISCPRAWCMSRASQPASHWHLLLLGGICRRRRKDGMVIALYVILACNPRVGTWPEKTVDGGFRSRLTKCFAKSS